MALFLHVLQDTPIFVCGPVFLGGFSDALSGPISVSGQFLELGAFGETFT